MGNTSNFCYFDVLAVGVAGAAGASAPAGNFGPGPGGASAPADNFGPGPDIFCWPRLFFLAPGPGRPCVKLTKIQKK